MLPYAVHAMLADMLQNPTRTQKQRKSCDVTDSGYEAPEQDVTKVQDWVCKHMISNAKNKVGQMVSCSLMMKKRRKNKPEIWRGQSAGYAHQRHRDNASEQREKKM
jgi:hypothetical protein